MLETLAGITVVLLVIVVVIAVIVLSIVKLVNRIERRVGKLTRGLPRARPGPRAKSRGPARPRTTVRPSARSGPAGSIGGAGAATGAGASAGSGGAGRVQRAAVEPRAEMRWMGADQTLRVHELAIAGPMAYVGADRRASGVALDPSEIVAGLAVNPRGQAGALAEWVTYARLSPEQRFAYLKWLANGRLALGDGGFPMLHLLGLERRALADGLDLGAVVHEVCRLREMGSRALAARERASENAGGDGSTDAGGGRRLVSYMRHSGSLLWTLVARRPEAFTQRDVRVLAGRTGSWSEEALASALAWFAGGGGSRGGGAGAGTTDDVTGGATGGGSGIAMPSWLARIVAEQQPGARRSVVLDRLAEKFDALFEARYAERHGDGILLRSAKRDHTLSYRPANHTLESVQTRVPDVLGISSQFGVLVELWNGCIDDLRGMARVGTPAAAGRTTGAITLAQWDAMPADLKVGMENPFAAGLAELAAKHADGKGHAIVGVSEVIAAVRMAHQADRQTYTAAQCKMLARAVEEAGMAIEPDARLTDAGMSRDAGVALLATRIAIEDGEGPAARYLAATCVLRLGAAVALADGEAEDRELEPIALELERAFALSEDDHRRLDALMALLRARGSSVKAVGKRLLAGLTEDARKSVGRLLVAVASADGSVGEAERAALKSSYRALGLGVTELDAALDALRATPAAAGDSAVAPLVLDHAAIARIMAETKEVAQILADAMRGDVDEEEADEGAESAIVPETQSTPLVTVAGDTAAASASTPKPTGAWADGVAAASAASAAPVGLSPRYAAFWTAISARGDWSEQEASGLARSMGLMLSGAVEAVNDWSYERAGGPVLIEEAGRVVVDAERVRALG